MIFLRPSLGLAAIAWRWSFGAAAGLLLVLTFFEYLDTLPVSKSDLLLLRTGQPALISRAVVHIFRGSGFRVVEAAAILVLTLGIAWVVVASLARAATIKALLAYFREAESSTRPEDGKNWRLRSLAALNLFRFVVTLAAVGGLSTAVVLGGAVSRPDDPALGSALLIMLTVVMLVWFAWSALNWFLSLATMFVVAQGEDAFGAIAAAVGMCRDHAGSVFAVGTWFGFAHVTAFVVASSVAAFPLGFAGLLPGGVVLGGALLVTLLYFAIADFLYIGRLAAYVALLELPSVLAQVVVSPPAVPGSGGHFLPQSAAGVDKDEVILSDVPLGWKPAHEPGL